MSNKAWAGFVCAAMRRGDDEEAKLLLAMWFRTGPQGRYRAATKTIFREVFGVLS